MVLPSDMMQSDISKDGVERLDFGSELGHESEQLKFEMDLI